MMTDSCEKSDATCDSLLTSSTTEQVDPHGVSISGPGIVLSKDSEGKIKVQSTEQLSGEKKEEVETSGPISEEDADGIKKEVQRAIDNITKNPGQISNIINSLKDDRNVLRQVMDFVQKNPDLKKQAMGQAMGSTPTMQQLSRMSKKERDEILRKAKEARKELSSFNPLNNKAVIINASRVAKNYPVGAEFPSGSSFCDGTVEELKDDLFYVYMPDEKRINKRATDVVGHPTRGEIVIFRLDENQENIVDFTLDEFNVLFPKKQRGGPSSSMVKPTTKSTSKPGKRRK